MQLPLFLAIATTNLVARAQATRRGAAVNTDMNTDTRSSGSDSEETALQGQTAQTVTTAVSMGAVAGLLLGGATFAFARPLSVLYCREQAGLVEACASYIAIRALAFPAVVTASVAQAALIGLKDAKTPMRSVSVCL
jgi:hypothetical protein